MGASLLALAKSIYYKSFTDRSERVIFQHSICFFLQFQNVNQLKGKSNAMSIESHPVKMKFVTTLPYIKASFGSVSAIINEGLLEVLENKETLAKYQREQGNMSLFLGSRGTKLNKLEDKNILI